MKILLGPAILSAAILLSGCAEDKSNTARYGDFSTTTPTVASNQVAASSKLIVTPADSLSGKVSRVDTSLRFAVLTFPIGHVPDVSHHLTLYRQGLKVGEVTVTGPQRNDSTVADITAGEAEIGDEVRDR